MTDLKNNLEEVWNDEYKDFMLSFYPESSPLVSTWEIYRMAKIKSQKEIKNLLELTEALNQIRDNLQDENRKLEQELLQVKKEAEFWKEEYVSHSETMCKCQEELQKTREQLDIATKHISKLLDIESHYEDCSYYSDDETCDCGNEENYYKPARGFCINVKDKQGEG